MFRMVAASERLTAGRGDIAPWMPLLCYTGLNGSLQLRLAFYLVLKLSMLPRCLASPTSTQDDTIGFFWNHPWGQMVTSTISTVLQSFFLATMESTHTIKGNVEARILTAARLLSIHVDQKLRGPLAHKSDTWKEDVSGHCTNGT